MSPGDIVKTTLPEDVFTCMRGLPDDSLAFGT
jgi:hypothetical protein